MTSKNDSEISGAGLRLGIMASPLQAP
jgi:hypothetical protein